MGREGKIHQSISDIVTPARLPAALQVLPRSRLRWWSWVRLTTPCDWPSRRSSWQESGVNLDSQKILLESAALFYPGTMEVATDVCHKHMKLYKGLVPALLDSQEAADRMPVTICAFEQKQASLFLMLLKAAAKLEPKTLWQMVTMEMSAKKLYSLQKLKAGDLTLVPATDAVGKITDKIPGSSSKHATLQFEGQDYFVLPPKSFKAAAATTPAPG